MSKVIHLWVSRRRTQRKDSLFFVFPLFWGVEGGSFLHYTVHFETIINKIMSQKLFIVVKNRLTEIFCCLHILICLGHSRKKLYKSSCVKFLSSASPSEEVCADLYDCPLHTPPLKVTQLTKIWRKLIFSSFFMSDPTELEYVKI